ncbi:MAG: ABC transporter substrate-binding protein [Chloroflexi bacterium]|nr:ABC transporter substrate-binding protein [Chloroflexota bacterium]
MPIDPRADDAVATSSGRLSHTHLLVRLPRRRLLAAMLVSPVVVPLAAACGSSSSSSAAGQPTAASTPAGGAAATTPPTAAAGATSAPASGGGTTTLTWWVPNFHQAAAQDMQPKFEAAHPDLKINQVQTVSNGLFQKIFTTLQGSNQPDLIDVANGWNPIFAQGNLVLDLTSHNIDQSDWLPNPLATATYQGKLYGIPFRSEAIAQLWNKQLLQNASLDPAQGPQSWDDLVSMATKTNHPPDAYGFGLIAGDPGNTFFRLATFIWANGGDLLSGDYTQAICNQPPTVEAVQFYTDLATKYHVAPDTALTATTEQMDGLFVASKLALYQTGQYIRPNIQQNAPNLQWAVEPTIKRQTIAGPLGGWNWVIPRGAPHPDAAWQLIDFMSQTGTMADVAVDIGVFPSRKSALADPRFQDPQLAPFAQQLQYARATPPIQQWNDVQQAFVSAVQSIIAGQASSVQSAMDEAASDINKVLGKS